jgi:alpha/beta superfamily hydrolase
MLVLRQPANIEQILIDGPAGPLECVLEDPQADNDGSPEAFAVVCHPHPLHQGTMHNKVAHTLARAALGRGAPALRFNFRGTGRSGGTHDEGRGETDDALAAIDWMRARHPGAALWLMGFSFGAMVALRAAAAAEPARLVTVAPAVARFLPDHPPVPAVPWLLVQGLADELVDAVAVRAWAAAQTPPPTLHEMPGVSHFFHGHLHELRDSVAAFLDAPGPANG